MGKSKFSDDPKAMHFQVQFTKDDCGSFGYFSALDTEEARAKAVEVAMEYLTKGYENARFRSFGFFEPIKTVRVAQWDRRKGEALRGGMKFKLRLSYVQATYKGGGKERQEWYEADEISIKNQRV